MLLAYHVHLVNYDEVDEKGAREENLDEEAFLE